MVEINVLCIDLKVCVTFSWCRRISFISYLRTETENVLSTMKFVHIFDSFPKIIMRTEGHEMSVQC